MAVLRGNGGHVLSAVFNAVQVVAEPAVQDLVIAGIADVKHIVACGVGRGQVAVLMQQDLHILTGLLEGVVHQLEFLGADVVVVDAVDDQGRALDLIGIEGIVPDLPGIAVQSRILAGIVAVQTGLLVAEFAQIIAVLVADAGIVIVADIIFNTCTLGSGNSSLAVQITAGAVSGQGVGVGRAAAGGNALRVGILIPAGDTGHRNDGLQTLHTGGGQAELGGAGIGTAGHAHAAVGPVGMDLNVAGLVSIRSAFTAEPLDNALESVNLQIGAAGLKALGTTGTQTAALYHSIAANQIVVIPVQILVVHHVLKRIVIIPVGGIGVSSGFHGGSLTKRSTGFGLCIELRHVIAVFRVIAHAAVGAAGDVGTGLIDGSSLIVALRSSAGHLHQSLHQIQLAVIIGIVVGLHIDTVTDDVAVLIAVSLFHSAGGKGEDRLGHAVDKQRLMCAAVLHSALQRLIAIAVHQFAQERRRKGFVCIVLILVQHSKAVGQSHTVGLAAQLAVIHASGLEQHP